jgi:hypothetical protein
MPLHPTIHGLLARAGDYEPLRAFSQGGCYWDKAPQQLLRESRLAEFLPPVEVEKDDDGKYGRFHLERGGRELLSHSKPLGPCRVPPEQLRRLKEAIEDFRSQARDPAAQPQNRELIQRFRLPDLKLEPELYRLVGPWWNHRLQILWGCERRRDSSLPPAAAVEKLEEDRLYNLRRVLAALLLLLLLLLPAWWLSANWSQVQNWLAHRASPRTVASGDGATSGGTGQINADSPEAVAQRAQAAAEKARADADLARQKANQTRADAQATKKEADDAQAAADMAEQIARDARAAADKAQAAAAAQKARDHVLAPKGASPQAPASPPAIAGPQGARSVAPPKVSVPGANPPRSAIPGPPSQTGASSSNPLAPGTGSLQPAGTSAPPVGGSPASPPSQPTAPTLCQIVLCDQGQPAADGTMAIALEVRPPGEGATAVPVQAWYYDGKTVTAKNRLEANLKAGDHLIKAAILDPSGTRTDIQGVLTVEPGQVITTPGKVSLRPKP